MLYFLVAFFATILGSVAGLGGGVIIKPVLDFMGDYSLETISVLSAMTVFSMAIVSIIKIYLSGFKFKVDFIILIIVGSVLGGAIGKSMFNYLISNVQDSTRIADFQSLTLALLMGLILYLFNHNITIKINSESRKIILFTGGVLGFISAFLGIGGGPLNVAVLMLLFSMKPKEAACNSIVIIFFSQFTSLLLVVNDITSSQYQLEQLPLMIAGGIIGGWVGSKLSGHVSDKCIQQIFSVVLVLIITVNLYNLFT